MKYDAVLIADVAQRLQEAERTDTRIDVEQEAVALSFLLRPLGRCNRCIALVPQNRPDVSLAFQRAGFATRLVKGNRRVDVSNFVQEEIRNWRQHSPDHLVLMATDPAFAPLCSRAAQANARVSVWSPSHETSKLLQEPTYDWRFLEDLLPIPIAKERRVAIYLDYENLQIGLSQRGHTLKPWTMLRTIRDLTSDLGKMVDMIAYADWGVLMKNCGMDVQRELVLQGATTVYVINHRGKNAADMALANDVRTRLALQSADQSAIDTLVIGSCDRDFCPVLETAQTLGKKSVVIGLSKMTSRELGRVAEVRHLDKYFTDKRHIH